MIRLWMIYKDDDQGYIFFIAEFKLLKKEISKISLTFRILQNTFLRVYVFLEIFVIFFFGSLNIRYFKTSESP